jgi:hypothetical protein
MNRTAKQLVADWTNGNRTDAVSRYLLLPEWVKILVILMLDKDEAISFSARVAERTQ